MCFVAGNGGNYCVPPSVVGRMTPGTKQGGAACTTGTECRSGLCGSTNVCEDACCSANTASCTAGASCAFGKFFGATFDQHSGFRCATGGGSGGNESTCFRDTDCKSTLCANFGGGFNSTCHAPCRNTADCSNGDACVDFQTASMTDISVACVAPQGQANVGLGGQCGSNDSVCKSQQCDRATGKCSDVCFSDADCSSASGYKCRPTTITLMGGGMVTVLACVPG